jgi:hypothetical protein
MVAPLSRAACVALLAGGFVLGAAAPASAALVGGCKASGTQVQQGRSYDAVSTDFAKLPRKGDVKWHGSVPVPPTKRVAVGEVKIKFPWPVGDVEIGNWGKDGKTTSSNGNSGTYHYDLPQAIAGIKVLVHGRHQEPSGVRCSGSVVVQLEGTSPLAWGSLALTIVLVLNMGLLIRARKAAS